MFAISSTTVDSQENFAHAKDVIQKFIDKYGIQKVKYSLLTFGNEPSVHFKFNSTLDEVKMLMEMISVPSGGALLHKAMETAVELFNEAEGLCNLKCFYSLVF